ncbi:MAG: DUF4402 domain-containing protein [Gemmatimonadota bacterium]
MRYLKPVSLAVAGLLMGGNLLNAQSANINATATVLSPITVTAGSALAFGNVTPGVAKTVAATSAAAGSFSLVGQANQGINVSFTLPATLTGPGTPMPMSAWTGLYNSANNQGAAAAFTPSASAQAGTTAATGGTFFVWVGATVTPAAIQTAGAYTGSVTMNVVYQ